MKIVEGVLRVLGEEGEASPAEIARALGVSVQSISATVARLRRATPLRPQRVCVSGWSTDADGDAKPYIRPLLALGARPDAPRPRPKSVEQLNREWRARNKGLASSVWVWAARADHRIAAGVAVLGAVKNRQSKEEGSEK